MSGVGPEDLPKIFSILEGYVARERDQKIDRHEGLHHFDRSAKTMHDAAAKTIVTTFFRYYLDGLVIRIA